ncbi:1-phosphatidylinositol phosphodiesterase [Fusarium beomiforme]|uniref:1-phosphatidylinositol phosphodiesterase n=1 Tax=Fusarium beomiforme TaxID=44412 RepID=A0A9P5AUS8_9HYPO|nr:1-phosphatidylinositol phosphodiesterase [Fusarium beomiforme]
MTRSAKDWMGDLSGDLNITQISIPGTHNSHAIKSNIDLGKVSILNPAAAFFEVLKAVATCQVDPIWKQLQNGVRFFDLRVRSWAQFENEGGRWAFGLCHGSAKLKESLTQVLDGMADFLSNHPTETLIISIKWDEEILSGKSSDPTTPDLNLRFGVSEIWDKYNWFKGVHWPNLSEVRGRAILARRFWIPDNEPLGVNFYKFYDHPRSEGPEGKWKQMPNPKEFSMTIENRWNSAKGMLNEAKEADLNDGVMYFASTCDTWLDTKGHLPRWWEPRYYAERLNPELLKFMVHEYNNPSKGRYGVVVTDFCEAPIARVIFEQNFNH